MIYSSHSSASEIYIGESPVGPGNPSYVIAEVGSNHNGNFDTARYLIDAAAKAKVNAVKFQTFRASEHYSRNTPSFDYLDNVDTFSLIENLEIDRSWHQPLKDHCDSMGVSFLSSPCDSEAINELSKLGMPAFKVASFDIPDLDLVRQAAHSGRPVILSTGMASWSDIQAALDVCRAENNNQVILLQCTSLYPAPVSLSNLKAMDAMHSAFGTITGYSDHTEGHHIALAAVTMGASMIEKHFTLDSSMKGPDHSFAIEPEELSTMVQRIRDIEVAMGDGQKEGPRPEEREMFEKGRRSLHARVAIPQGTRITDNMLVTKRPGFGIQPSMRETVIGRTARTNIQPDQWITWDMI